ncbi:MAG: helicase-exonuclease AddAB subunit AddA [Lachnospiraceae bacterium]|nr:helicase-exonuclease AddAB subunit AddA [Lachnospiraceae bacterium]
MAEKKKKIRFTEEQKEVIESRRQNLLVSAAAGSGKTAVLTERIIRLVSDGDEPADIDRILVVTFTRAAAAQMKERISAALSARIADDPGNRHLRRQELLLPHARIMTIDAFCQYILRNEFDAAGIDPSFRVADDGEIELLKNEAVGEILEEEYEKATPEFLELADAMSPGALDKALETQIKRLGGFAESMPWPELWLRKERDKLAGTARRGLVECAGNEWITDVIKRTEKELACCIDELTAAMRISESPDGPYMYTDTITADIENLKHIYTAGDLKELGERFRTDIFGKLSSRRDDAVSPGKRAEVKDIRDNVKDTVNKIKSRYFSAPYDEMEQREHMTVPVLTELIEVTLKYRKRLEEKKREKSVIDFSDMEHLALGVFLKEPEDPEDIDEPEITDIARSYAEYFTEIMVDEYQDSNFVQELILGAIAGESAGRHDRFMVGDIKQSIYRFRLARPEIFMDKLGRYHRDPGFSDRRIDLHRNFRSSGQIIDFVNAIFRGIMLRDVGGVDYDEDAMLVAGEGAGPGLPDNIPEIMLLDLNSGGDSDDRQGGAADTDGPDNEPDGQDDELLTQDMSKEEAEASMIAGRILELVSTGTLEDKNGGVRRVRWGDIVILLRATSGVDEIYRNVLDAAGIPVYIESRKGYFQAREIRLMLDLMRVIVNPLSDIPLAGVLRSAPFGGFDDEELALVRVFGMRSGNLPAGVGLYECLSACASGASPVLNGIPAFAESGIDDALSQKCIGFLDRLDSWREAAGWLSVRELLDNIIEETRFEEYVAALPGGARRSANVRILLGWADNMAMSVGAGLTDFMNRVEQYRLIDVDQGEANVLPENADVVRIMSIHKSKGLEFPVVFAAGLSRNFNRQDERSAVLLDDIIGPAIYAFDRENRVRYSTLKRLAVADKQREESLGEEIRVLYVAMTRAEQKLILTAAEKDISKWADMAAGKVPVSYLKRAHASCFLDLIREAAKSCPGLFRLTCVRKDEISTYETAGTGAGEYGCSELLDAARSKNINSYLMNRITERLDEKYAHPELEKLEIKTTVTELKERSLEEEEDKLHTHRLIQSTEEGDIVPDFMRETRIMKKTERGTAYHKVMEILDAEILEDDSITNRDLINKNRNIVQKWMKNKEESGLLSKGYSNAVRAEDVLVFLSSDLGQRMREAFLMDRLFREKQFMMEIPAARVTRDAPENGTTLIQGVIDAYFVSGEGAVELVDYKTDAGVDDEELVKRYGVQLSLYAEAIERILDLKVKEKWIWSFTLGHAIPLPK